MNKLILVSTLLLSCIGSIGAQDMGSETFRIFKPDYVSFHAAGFCQVGEEFVLTYSSIDDDGDDIEYNFGLSQPYVTPDSVSGVYDKIEDGDEITYLYKSMPVTAIGTYAVQHTNIKSFFTGNSVKMLYDYALHMSNSRGQGSIHLALGKSVELLGHKAIVGDGIDMIVVAAEIPPVWMDDESIVLDNTGYATIVVPDGSIEAYTSDPRWSKLGRIYTFSEYGLDMFSDSGYITYNKFEPTSRIMLSEDECMGYTIENDKAVMTYAFAAYYDCICDPSYVIMAPENYVFPTTVEHNDGVSYPVKIVASYSVHDHFYSQIESFDTGDSVEIIYDNAVRSSPYIPMKYIRLGSSVKFIGDRGVVVGTSDSVESLIVAAEIPPVWGSTQSILIDNPESIKLIVPDESIDAYKSHRYWSKFTNIHSFSSLGLEGVEDINVDESSTPASFYNLQGIPVKYPSNGIYIKVENNRSSIIRL